MRQAMQTFKGLDDDLLEEPSWQPAVMSFLQGLVESSDAAIS